MSGAACQVQRARVLGGAPDEGPRWRFVAEDALRTAEFGDAGRLLLVRRLRLAGLPARPAPGQITRALEAAWAAQVRLAQPALAPGAAHAPAVWFASRPAAQAAWLAAWAEDDEALLAAWYWPAALEGIVPARPSISGPAVAAALWASATVTAPQAWRQLLASWPDRRLAVLAQRWAEGGTLPMTGPLTALVGTPEAPWSVAQVPEPSPPAGGEAAAVAAAAQRLQALPQAAALPEPARAWLAAHWLGQALPAVRPVAVRRVLAAAVLEQAPMTRPPSAARPGEPRQVGVAEPRPRTGEPSTPTAPPASPAPKAPAPPAPRRHAASIDAGRPSATPDVPPQAAAAPRPAALQRLAAARPWLAEGQATAHGGLLLLLNLLPRLGFPAWLAAQPEPVASIDTLFLHLLDATGAAREDPQRAWFDASARADPGALRAWRLRLRRALRRQARIDLGELVRRPALVQATPTHLDLVFPLDQVDLRLRRAGLDLDPGWVPWFGRIVSFHYL